jgi:flagellar protein FlbD
MIILTKLNGIQFALNCDMIETISENPDTTIFLTNGNIHIVKESMQEVIEKTVEYRRRIFSNLLRGVSE